MYPRKDYERNLSLTFGLMTEIINLIASSIMRGQ